MKSIKHIFVTLLALIALSSSISAQHILRGRVTEVGDDTGIPGVSVYEINNNNRMVNGVITDFNGNYIIEVRDVNTMIKFSFIGYATHTETYTGATKEFNVVLKPETLTLDAVNIVAERNTDYDDGFMAISKENQVTAVSRIDMKDVATESISNIGEALQGQVSGVDVSMGSGDPGAGLQIKIRGTTSLSGTSAEPLIILNGMPLETDLSDFDFGTDDLQDYSSLLDVPVEDIMDIQILKDAASAAVYGAKAANGVIIIKTKRGQKGKPRVEMTYNNTTRLKPQQIPMLNGDQYSTMMLEAMFNANNYNAIDMPEELSYDPNYEFFNEYSQNTDWVDAISRIGQRNNVNLAVSGGGEFSRYRLSTTYNNEKGTVIGSNLNSISTTLNFDSDISDKLRVSTDFTYSHVNNDKSHDYKINNNTVRGMAYKKAPNMAIYEMDEDGNTTDVYFSPETNYQGSGYNYFNPVAMGNEAVNNIVTERVRSAINLKYDIIKGLRYTGYAVFDVNNFETRKFLPQIVVGTDYFSDNTNKAGRSDGKRYNFQHRSQVNYGKTFRADAIANLLGAEGSPVQTISVVGAYSMNVKNSVSTSNSSMRTASSFIKNSSTPSPITSLTAGLGRYRRVAFTGSAHYKLLNRYLFNGTVRSEATSKLSAEHQWKNFYAFGVGWILTEENYLRDLDWLEFWKLRYSYGQNGNLPDNSAVYNSNYSSSDNYLSMPAMVPTNMQLNTLTYEITEQYNLGTEFRIAGINFEFELYKKVSNDIITKNLQIPSNTGYSTLAYGNGASIKNSGWEFNTSGDILKNQDFRISYYFNVSENQNEVLKLPDGYDETVGNPATNGSYVRQVQSGKPVGSFFGYKFKGVYAYDDDNMVRNGAGDVIYELDGVTPRRYTFNEQDGYLFKGGDAIYEDVNKDGVINSLDVVYIGDANADFYGGFGFNFFYKNWSVRTSFNYSIGNDVINAVRMNTENMYNKNNQSVSALRRWRKPGDITDMPRALFDEGYNWLGSDRFVEDASYLRLKTVKLSYRFDKGQLRNVGISELNLFTTAYNLLTFTKYSGQDPNVGFSRADPWAIGTDNARTPPSVSFIFGFNLKF